jgi:hypothetical protein
MVKVSESVIKAVNDDKRKWLTRLTKRYWRREQRPVAAFSWPICLPVDSRHLTQRTSQAKRGNPVSLPASAGTACREARLWRCGIGMSEEANAVL